MLLLRHHRPSLCSNMLSSTWHVWSWKLTSGRINGNEFLVWNCLNQRRDRVVLGRAKCWNHSGGLGALSRDCVNKETDSLLYDVNNKLIKSTDWLHLLHGWAIKKTVPLMSRAFSTSYSCQSWIALSSWQTWELGMWLWFKGHMNTNRRLTKIFVGWHNFNVFPLPPRDLSVVVVPLPDCWVGWKPRSLLLVQSTSVLANYSSLTLCGTEADKARIWLIAITEFHFYALVPFVAATIDCFFISKAAKHVSMQKTEGCWCQCLSNWKIGGMIWVSPWSFISLVLALGWRFFRFVKGVRWIGLVLILRILPPRVDGARVSVIGLADESVPKRKWEVDGLVVYHECRLPFIAARFKYDVCLRSLDDAVTATQETFGDQRPDSSPDWIGVSASKVFGDEEGDWDIGNVLSGSYFEF